MFGVATATYRQSPTQQTLPLEDEPGGEQIRGLYRVTPWAITVHLPTSGERVRGLALAVAALTFLFYGQLAGPPAAPRSDAPWATLALLLASRSICKFL